MLGCLDLARSALAGAAHAQHLHLDRLSFSPRPTDRWRLLFHLAALVSAWAGRARETAVQCHQPHAGVVERWIRRVPQVLLVRRGGCAFSLKVAAAAAAGYCAVIVANFRAGAPHPYYGLAELPDMTAEPPGGSDESMPIPAWLISRAAGDILEAAAAAGGAVHVSVRDEPRKPALGNRQSDAFGIRDHHSE
eukprot:TRINITY_DN30252_c0_g1_i1.p2 TRINITY_DN30252_c0_g1~~TRINITY_DN30252_c0_g1_i1.p2  ORF type:complete len:192 (-),score=18.74 TRINITY_DN30252_c0_g1_i1:107-682(-)